MKGFLPSFEKVEVVRPEAVGDVAEEGLFKSLLSDNEIELGVELSKEFDELDDVDLVVETVTDSGVETRVTLELS